MVQVQVRNEMKQELQIADENPLLIAFQKYLSMTYSNEKTRYLYEQKAINFLNNIYHKTKEEPTELTQNILDDYVIWLNTSKNQNPFYRGFIRAFRLCFDPYEKIYRLQTKLDKSKARTSLEEYDWLDKSSVDKIIERGSPYISLLTSIYFDTGRRLSEVILCDLESKEWDLDLVKRRLKGIAKGNVEFQAHFSKDTAKRIYEWMKSPLCINKNKPFYPYKTNGEPYGNQSSSVWYEFRKQCRLLEIRNVTGGEPHPHCLVDKAKILTINGWKSNREIKEGDKILSYNIDKNIIEEDKILKITRFKYSGKIYQIKKQKYINTLMTKEHKNIIKLCKTHDEKWKKKGIDVWDKKYKLISIEELLSSKRRKLFKIYKNPSNIRNIKLLLSAKKKSIKTLGVYKSAILGWIMTDGCINWRLSKYGTKNVNITISQSLTANPHKCKIIEHTLKKAQLVYTKNISKFINRNNFNSKKYRPYQVVIYRICNENIDWIFKYLTNKKRPIYNTLLQLNYNELKSLQEAMMLGDGSINGEFTTQNKLIIDFFRTISTLIGYRTQLGYGKLTLKKGKKYRTYLTKKDNIQILKKHIKEKRYSGYVWCPETKNHTWIAKDNETMFITGNCVRHATGRYLSQEKGWAIEQVATKLGHKKIDNTRKYTSLSIEQIEKKEDEEIFDK